MSRLDRPVSGGYDSPQPPQREMQDMSLGTGAAPFRKKKTRHVLDASLAGSSSNGFSSGQWRGPDAASPAQQGNFHTSRTTQSINEQPQHGQSQVPYRPPGYEMDTDQIPNLTNDARESADYYRANPFYTGQSQALSPPANIDFFAIDTGVSNPKFARLSMGLAPSTNDIATACQLPISLILQPLADLRHEEGAVPVIDCIESGVPRCHRCRAYINPGMHFVEGGAKFICNICKFPNETPAEYYSPVDMNARRQDWDVRPELQFGTCDFLVGKDYWSKERKPQTLNILFAIDVSEQSLLKGVPKAATDSIRNALYGSEDQHLPTGTKIGIMTFDRACHFYNLKHELPAATQMMCVTDVDDVFVPINDGLFVDPDSCQTAIETTLDSIGKVFDRQSVPEPALGAVTKAAYMAMHATGGKLCLFLGALPTWGPGKLKVRENPALYNTPEEKALYNAQNIHWQNVSEEFVGIGVGVDCFFFPSSYIDIATVGTLSQNTGGDTFFYQNFIAERDSEKFSQELHRSLYRQQGTAVQMKIRCSNGLKVVSILGNFLQRGPSDLEMGQIDADKAITCVLKHDDKLDPTQPVHFQSAVLYTTAEGQRVLRTQNIRCPVSSSVGDVMRSCDAGAAIVTFAKQAVYDVLKKDLKSVKHYITEQCIRILAAYRRNCAAGAPASELILPESLKLFPMLTLALQKQFAFRTDAINSDVRVNNQRLIRSASARDLLSLIYPRLIPIHSLQPEDGFADDTNQLVVPSAVKNSFSNLENGGAYILDNGQTLFLWFKSDVGPSLLRDLYGPECTSLETLKPRQAFLPHLDTRLNIQVRNIIAYLNTFSSSRHLVPQIARQGLDGSEMIFAQALVEDRNCDAMSYVDFLVHIHRQVQVLLAEKQTNSGFSATRWISGTENAY